MGWRRKKEEGRHPSVSGGGEGYSRVVRINDPDYNSTNEYDEAAAEEDYPSNGISTTKYTVANFIPKSLFEQFRRVANLFFLVVACVSFSPLAPYRAVSVIFPLLVVVGATMAKEAVEDLRRKQQDIEINNRKVKVFDRNRASFNITQWKKLRVGDIVQVNKDEFFPADLLLLSSSNDDSICYVETMNLDGETNLKRKQCLKITSALRTEDSLKNFKAYIKCEDPNDKLYSFLGTLHHQGIQYPISPHSILLRDSKLRNTHHVYGVVIFTGHDTKVMQNATAPPSKRSKVEMKMDKIIYVLFTSLVVLSSVGSVFFGIKTKRDISSGEQLRRWYLRPDESSALFDPRRAVLASVFHFLTALMLFGSLIPISLYISIEIVKVLQSTFINQDREMYSEELDQPARARTSNLNEELGQVSTILSDKTGTLTCNSMEFVKCSIAGVDYGSSLSEVEIHVERGTNGGGLPFTLKGENDAEGSKNSVKGFNLKDDRLMHGKWVNAPHPDVIQMFFRVLAICHTAIPVLNDKSDDILYEAESPDEAAFVIAARELGFEFYSRKHARILLHEFDPNVGRKVDRAYELLNILEFSSSRKRMSVIIRTEDNQLLLLCKGADSVIFDKLAKEKQTFEAATRTHIRMYSEAGLRTIAVAYRTITEEEYRIWYDEFSAATNAVTAEHDELVEAAAEKIEKDLILIGATAVEDRLQKGVPECINKLSQAGIRIWVLTGDKLETAVNIGFACHLLRQDMKRIIISLDALDVDAVTAGDKKNSEMVSYECITRQLREARAQVCLSNGSSTPYALIIDGNSLAFALSSSLEKSFFAIAVNCASVLCCRTSPKQKALVTRLVKRNTSKTTLAIGDGANDVGMLQEADVGIGISGAEGMQAVMSSDFSIAQFRFLERLLLVHGHWCYRRITSMICYFFYKNITFGITLFCFEAHASFSAQPAYNDWFLSLYSVAFTSLPVIALGVFDKDLSSRACLKFPLLHQDGVLNIFFSWRRILGWMLNGVCSSIIIFYLTSSSIFEQSFRRDGRVAGLDLLGLTMYGCVVWTVNCQMALYLSYFTWIQHLVIWGSIAFWYVFATVYGLFPPSISTSAYMVFLEAACESPLYWLATLLVVVSALLPFFIFSVVQTSFFPKYHDLVRTEGLRNR